MSVKSSQEPSLSRLRRRARVLFRQHQAHDPAVVDLLRSYHPDFADLSTDEIFNKPLQLSDAQFVLARQQGQPAWPQHSFMQELPVGKPRVIPEMIPRSEYRRELAARRGLPPMGTRQVSCHGVEYIVIDHAFALSHASVMRAQDDSLVPHIDELSPMISFPTLSPHLRDLYAEVDRCTSKQLVFFDTLPDKFPRQAAPGVHEVRTTQDPRCLTFHFDASRLHETIIGHEFGHLWIEFVEGCEDWRNLRDQSDLPRVVQFQHIQSFVLDLKVNELLQSRGFDMSVINNDQLETIQELALHCAQGDLPRTKRAAAGIANTLAAVMLEHTRWSNEALLSFQTCLAVIQSAQPELYRLAEQFVASVKGHGYGDRVAICQVIDECAILSFQATGDNFDIARDLVEDRPTEWMQDKHSNFLPGFPVATKLAVWKEASRFALGAHVQWEIGVTGLGRVDVRLWDGSGRKSEPLVLSLDIPMDLLDVSRLEHTLSAPILSPTPLRRRQPCFNTPTNLQPSTRPQITLPLFPLIPSLNVLPGNTAWTSTKRHYMAGVGRWLSKAGFEEQWAGEHTYGYSQNNPVNNLDPSGKFPAQPNCNRYLFPPPPKLTFRLNARLS